MGITSTLAVLLIPETSDYAGGGIPPKPLASSIERRDNVKKIVQKSLQTLVEMKSTGNGDILK